MTDMPDMPENEDGEVEAPAEPVVEVVQQPTMRVFKTGSTRIVEDESMRGKSIEQVQAMLAPMYPELKAATIRTRAEGNLMVVEFLPQPGRKG